MQSKENTVGFIIRGKSKKSEGMAQDQVLISSFFLVLISILIEASGSRKVHSIKMLLESELHSLQPTVKIFLMILHMKDDSVLVRNQFILK